MIQLLIGLLLGIALNSFLSGLARAQQCARCQQTRDKVLETMQEASRP